jgi:hypothetical protein
MMLTHEFLIVLDALTDFANGVAAQTEALGDVTATSAHAPLLVNLLIAHGALLWRQSAHLSRRHPFTVRRHRHYESLIIPDRLDCWPQCLAAEALARYFRPMALSTALVRHLCHSSFGLS